MSQTASVLCGTKGERVALCDCFVSAVLRDLLGEVTVTQTYRNDEDVNIEAVYTFPLPLDAVLLDLSVTIGERKLKGEVVEKKAAEERYEDAIADGNAAVMLEEAEPGLYTMNVGNLLPKETAVVTFTYALMYRWVGDTLRIMIPTTIAPRYGESPLQPHQTPESSLMVENQFSLEVAVFGSLRDASFECPSHQDQVTEVSSPDKKLIRLIRAKAAMDRDFILNVKAPEAKHSFALAGADLSVDDGQQTTAVVAAFQPVFPGLRKTRPLNLVVVIDCSGSMQGDSITQGKEALGGILAGLRPADRVTIVAFGNTTKTLFDQPRACTDANIRLARQFVDGLKADMGGTEIGGALQAAYEATRGSEGADILLVTDGEVSEWKSVVAAAKASGSRIFTVGVGHAVSEAFVRELAKVTGGECELVSPREGMADRVVRHFERMRAPRAKRVVIHWPEGARNQTPARFGSVFEGDTVFVSAQFDRRSVTGNVVLEIETETGQVVRQEVAIGQAPAPQSGSVSTVARLAAAGRIQELDQEAATLTAVQYQLTSPWTNWLVVAQRPDGEKVFEIPAIRKVPQTLAAGWGGVGFTMPAMLCESALDVSRLHSPRELAVEASPEDENEEELQRAALLLAFIQLSKQVDVMTRDIEAMTGHTDEVLLVLQARIDELVARVGSALRAMERQAEQAQSVHDDLVGRSPDSEDLNAIADIHARLEVLRQRLSRMRTVLARLAHCQHLLGELEAVLQRG